jgi:8-oxo-dGTP pyrophosphatase MutT (NUDIX family)
MDEPPAPAAEYERPRITRLAENAVFSNQFATVYNDPVQFADGRQGNYLRIVESSGQPGVAMLAICGDRVALVKTYRYPVGTWEWAIPRGFAHGNDPDDSARAELAEELGGEPDNLVPLGNINPNSGILASRVRVYLAQYSEAVAEPADKDEITDVRWIATAELGREIAAGNIGDAFTLSAISLAQCHALIEPICSSHE